MYASNEKWMPQFCWLLTPSFCLPTINWDVVISRSLRRKARKWNANIRLDEVTMASLKSFTQLDGALKLAFGMLMAHKKSITRRGKKKVFLALTAITFTLTFFSFFAVFAVFVEVRANENRYSCDKFQKQLRWGEKC